MQPSAVLGTGLCQVQCQTYSKHNRNASYPSDKLRPTCSHKRESLLEAPTACNNNCTWHFLLGTLKMGRSFCIYGTYTSILSHFTRLFAEKLLQIVLLTLLLLLSSPSAVVASIYLCRYNKPFQCNPVHVEHKGCRLVLQLQQRKIRPQWYRIE